MDYREILYQQDGGIARITLNRPEKRNPLGAVAVNELCHALERARDDREVRVVILTGAGAAFCAGGDLSQLRAHAAADDDEGAPPRTFLDLLLAFGRVGKPTIAMVNGSALGGGLGLVACCDLALAADDAELGTPEINVGLWPMMIMAPVFRCVGRKHGLRLVMSGEKISAAEAARIGLVNEAVPAAELEARTLALSRSLAAKSPLTMHLGLEAFHATQDMPLEQALDYLERELAALLASEDAQEGIRAFLEKRAPVWRGR
jgi:enoyl-CoA hydratase/carnithine racemase